MRFTIRDLIWLTAIVALSTGWIISNRRAAMYEAGFQQEHRLTILAGDIDYLKAELEDYKRFRPPPPVPGTYIPSAGTTIPPPPPIRDDRQ
jgi:hypothetical protein